VVRVCEGARSLLFLPLATTSTASFHFESNGLPEGSRKPELLLTSLWRKTGLEWTAIVFKHFFVLSQNELA